MDALEVDLKILGGDFNLVLDKCINKQGGLPFTHETACKTLLEYCEGNNLGVLLVSISDFRANILDV